MGRKQLLGWECDFCGTIAETPVNADRPKGWESLRLPQMTEPKTKRAKPKLVMKKLLACPVCLVRLVKIVDTWPKGS